MKEIINEYATTALALVGTGLLLIVLGSVLLQKDAMLARLMELVLEGGM